MFDWIGDAIDWISDGISGLWDNTLGSAVDAITDEIWRELVIRQIPNIAKNQKIDLKNLRWYAAFHDKKTNPHVHIIVYSTNEREGFLTNHGIEKIRSGFVNDIYTDELHLPMLR